MERRLEFVELALKPEANLSSLCRRFEVSRKTGYKWIRRYGKHGLEGLADRSKAPLSSPGQTSESMERLVVAARQRYGWGGRKLHDLFLNMGEENTPAASTITGILKRHGEPIGSAGEGGQGPWKRFERERPNELWQMDFKGHIAMAGGGEGEDAPRCHPLTAVDDHSRYGLVVEALEGEKTEGVQEVLVRTFQRYGLPDAILCDNGPPWGSSYPGVFTRLGVWLLELGVDVKHGRPCHPQTQGKDERFNQTLKREVLSKRTVWRDLAHCQRAFDEFRDCYNLVRPHDSLGGVEPVTRYEMSKRRMPEKTAEMSEHYLSGDQQRKVRPMGMAMFKGQTFGIGRGFTGKKVAFRAVGEQFWEVYYGWKCLGEIDLSEPKIGKHRLRPLKPRS